jgi:hypothetical protein
MNTIAIKLFLAGLCVSGFFLNAKADVIPDGFYPVGRCVRIINTSSFPDIYVIGAVHAVNNKNFSYIINKDSCLTNGYKFNTCGFFWVDKSIVDSTRLENIDMIPYINDSLLAAKAGFYKIHVPTTIIFTLAPDGDSLIDELFEYALVSNSANITLTLYRHIQTFRSGSQKVVSFDPAPVRDIISNTKLPESAGIEISPQRLIVESMVNGKMSGRILDCRGRVAMKFDRMAKAGETHMLKISDVKSGFYILSLNLAGKQITRQFQIIH